MKTIIRHDIGKGVTYVIEKEGDKIIAAYYEVQLKNGEIVTQPNVIITSLLSEM